MTIHVYYVNVTMKNHSKIEGKKELQDAISQCYNSLTCDQMFHKSGNYAYRKCVDQVFCCADNYRQWNEELMQDACSFLAEEMNLSCSAPGGMVTYRRTLTISLFFKFYLTVQHKLAQEVRLCSLICNFKPQSK